MKASEALKGQAAQLLAAGKTEVETANTVGVSRSTIQKWKRNETFQSLISSHKLTAHVVKSDAMESIADSQRIIIQEMVRLRDEESKIESDAQALYDKVYEKSEALMEGFDVETCDHNQAISFFKLTAEIMKFRLMLSDRRVGLEAALNVRK